LASAGCPHGGHSTHGARQPIKEDYYLFRSCWTGGPGWLDAGINRSRNFRDVRAYRIDDQDGLAFKDMADFRKANLQENGWCHRPLPTDDKAKKYEAGKWVRAPFEYPNPEHQTLDLLYDRYLLFGDQRSYENMRTIAANGGFFAEMYAPHIIRQSGWSWRVIERYWELTGDKQAEALLRRVVKAYAGLIGKGPLTSEVKVDPTDYQSWHTMIWNRPLAMTALHLGNPQAIELAKTAAEGHEDKADYYCTLFAVLYHLTGEQKYKDAVMKASNNGQKIDVVTDVDDPNWSHLGHMFPCSALWLFGRLVFSHLRASSALGNFASTPQVTAMRTGGFPHSPADGEGIIATRRDGWADSERPGQAGRASGEHPPAAPHGPTRARKVRPWLTPRRTFPTQLPLRLKC
jgi:hypothetical protein